MENTKALEDFDRMTFYLNEAVTKKCFGSLGIARAIAKNLRTQLAERDAQLAAVAVELKALGEIGQHLCEGLEKIAGRQFCTTLPDLLEAPVAVAKATLTRSMFLGQSTRQPTQDKE